MMPVYVIVFLWLAAGTGGVFQQSGSPASVQQQVRIKRLILKDGTYELISSYQIKGDRIRFLSTDRHEWDEMPLSLVDWPATEKFARDEAGQRRSRLEELAAGEARDRAEADAASPEVASGIRLPGTGGVYLLDVFQGNAELNPMRQSGADINRNTGSNILRGIVNPVSSSKQTIELKGAHATLQSHVKDPSIYLSVDSEAEYKPESAQQHFRIVRCTERKGNRVVGALNIAVYGKAKQEAGYVDTKVEPVAGSWVRITPVSPLAAGEYALVEIIGKKDMNTYVWDFGVDPAAPANADSVRRDPAKADAPPVLLKRKK